MLFEYPRNDGDPYYPIPQPANAALYQSYKLLADTLPNVHFVGRLGTYKYYNMDQVVGQALALFEKLSAREALSSKTVVVMPSEGVADAGPDQTAESEQIQQEPGEAA